MADEINPLQPDTLNDDSDIMGKLDGVMAALAEEPATEPARDDRGKFVAQEESEVPPEGETEDAAPEEASGEDEQESEPETAIDPPASWAGDKKAEFAKLPPDIQEYISERESERERGLNAKLAETAELRKKFDTEAQQTQQERQRYIDTLSNFAQLQPLLDPILAEGMQTDWAKLAELERTGEIDPGTYNAKRAAFDQRLGFAQAIQAELQRTAQKQAEDARQNRRNTLIKEIPDLADDSKAASVKASLTPVLSEAGFSQAEIDGFWADHPDPRYVKVLQKALDGRKMDVARQTVSQKKANPVTKVQRPRAAETKRSGKSPDVVAKWKQAKETGRMNDLTDALLADIMEGIAQ